MRDVMIDLETLSTRPDAMIVAIGAVAFGPHGTGAEFYCVIDPTASPGHIDPATVAWWMQQSDEARAIFSDKNKGDRRSLSVALQEFRRFLDDGGASPRVWGHGSSFDLPIIESAFRVCGLPIPWGHRAGRDTRTILELAGVGVVMPEDEKHNALSDARAQALAVISAARVLGRGRLWPEWTDQEESGL